MVQAGRVEEYKQMKTIELALTYVERQPDEKNNRNRYIFKDLVNGHKQTRYKPRTEVIINDRYKNERIAVRDRGVLFTITDYWPKSRRRYIERMQNHSILVTDMKYAETLYKSFVRDNPGLNPDIHWRGGLPDVINKLKGELA